MEPWLVYGKILPDTKKTKSENQRLSPLVSTLSFILGPPLPHLTLYCSPAISSSDPLSPGTSSPLRLASRQSARQWA